MNDFPDKLYVTRRISPTHTMYIGCPDVEDKMNGDIVAVYRFKELVKVERVTRVSITPLNQEVSR